MTSRGQQKYKDGSLYDGEWNNDGERHGRGRLSYGNNTSYTGQFQHGLHSGSGVMIIPDTSIQYVAVSYTHLTLPTNREV